MHILVIITTGFVECGGITNAFMNYYRSMNLSDLIIDIASSGPFDNKLEEEVNSNGGKCFYLPSKQDHLFSYCIQLNSLIREQKYDLVDVHGNSATMLVEMLIARNNGIDRRMAHCLNSKNNHPFIHKTLVKKFNEECNIKTACTKEAGNYLYGDNSYVILKNVIDAEKYRYSVKSRHIIRSKYNINENDILIGTIGKINYQKNQLFLIPIVKKIVTEYNNVKLIIVGDGDKREELEKAILENRIKDKIILAGMQNNVVEYYSAFDIFVFPSLFEGQSLALLEAKCSGVVGASSSNIQLKEGDPNAFIDSLPLKEEIWSKKIEYLIKNKLYSDRRRPNNSNIAIEEIKRNGLDCHEAAKTLRSLYMNNYVG